MPDTETLRITRADLDMEIRAELRDGEIAFGVLKPPVGAAEVSD